MKIGILGAGAIGCYIGANLAKNRDIEVILVGRDSIIKEVEDAHFTMKLTEIAKPTVSIDVEISGKPIESNSTKKLKLSSSISELQDCNYIILTVKATATEQCAKELSQILEGREKSVVIISFQNGCHNPEILRKYLKNPVLAGMVNFNVVWEKPAHFLRGTDGEFYLEKSDKGLEVPITNALRSVGIPVVISGEMRNVLYSKLLLNLINSVNALSGVPLQAMLSDKGYRTVWAAAMEEALKLYPAANISPVRLKVLPMSSMAGLLRSPNWIFNTAARSMTKMDPKAKSSMLQDLERNRETEADILSGEIVALANQLNSTAPISKKITDLIKTAEQQKKGSPKISSSELCSLLNIPA